jgi:hypothetical protein
MWVVLEQTMAFLKIAIVVAEVVAVVTGGMAVVAEVVAVVAGVMEVATGMVAAVMGVVDVAEVVIAVTLPVKLSVPLSAVAVSRFSFSLFLNPVDFIFKFYRFT